MCIMNFDTIVQIHAFDEFNDNKNKHETQRQADMMKIMNNKNHFHLTIKYKFMKTRPHRLVG